MIAATCELWIDGVRVPDGHTGPPGVATVALAGLRIDWGRETTVDQPSPSQCSFELLSREGGNGFDAVVHIGSKILVWAAHGAVRRPVFAGWVSDLDASFDEASGGAVCRAVVTDVLADAANRYVGSEPWAGQYAFQRVEKILAAIGNPYAYSMNTAHDKAWWILSRMDVDRQPAQQLLYDVGASTGHVLWSATDANGKPVLAYEDTDDRPSQSRFLPSGAGSNVATNPGGLDNGSWRPRTGAANGTYAITWITGASGPPNPAGGTWTSWARKKWSVAATSSMGPNGWEIWNGSTGADWIPLTPCAPTTVSILVRVIGAYPRKMRLTVNSATGVNLGEAYITLTTNAWTTLTLQLTVPADTSGGRVICEAATVAQGGTPWAVNDQLDLTGLVVATTGGGLWAPVTGGSAGSGVAPLDACEVLRDPVEWARTVTDLLTRVTVRWMDQATTPNPTERTVTSVNTAAETTYGARALSVGTILSSSADATSRMTALLAANAPSNDWRATGLTIDLAATVDESDTDAVTLVMDLLGATTRHGKAVMLAGLPWWTPTDAAAQLFVEGGHYTFDEGRWLLALNTTPAVGTGNTLTLAQVDRTVRYVDVAPAVRYVDMVGVGP